MDPGKKKAACNPRESANWISSVFFIWTYAIFKKSRAQPLEVEDLWSPLPKDHSHVLGDRLEAAWNEELAKAQESKKMPSLLFVIVKTFFCECFIVLGLILCIHFIMETYVRASFLKLVLDYFQSGTETSYEKAILSASGLVLSSAISSLLHNHYMKRAIRTGIRIRASCCSLIYRKCLRLDRTALGEISPGHVVNLVSNDVSRFDQVCLMVHFLWLGPILSLATMYFLYQEVGSSGLAGLIIVFTVTLIQSYAGTLTSRFRLQLALKADERIRMTDEIISGIEVIKLFSWEKPFLKLLDHARRLEINFLQKISYIRGLYMTFYLSTARMALFFALLVYVAKGGEMTSNKVFVVAAYYQIISIIMGGTFVRGFAEAAECIVSVGRLQKFMLNKEYSPLVITKMESENMENTSAAVVLNNISAKWDKDESDCTLDSIKLNLERGKILGIIGSVGSGKSSLLQLLLGELPYFSGSAYVNGSLSYSSQEPWVFAGSIRQNILFGQRYDSWRYHKVLKVCCLERDLELLPNRDMTVVGERGASLSGGQRARITLARAVYKKADIYMLDDPLSAVDTHVGKHLFQDCIRGFLSKKTCLLVTHQLQYLSSLDKILLLHNGRVTLCGSYSKLVNSGLDYHSLLERVESNEELSDTEADQTLQTPKLKQHVFQTQRSTNSQQSYSSAADEVYSEEAEEESQEFEKQGATKGTSSTWVNYYRAGTNLCVLLVLLIFFVIAQGFGSLCDFWLAFWTNNVELSKSSGNVTSLSFLDLSTGSYIAVYGGLICGLFLTALVRSLLFYTISCHCSMGLHRAMAASTVGTSLSFFQSNPSGRILNRFSKDMGAVDEIFPKAVFDVGHVIGTVGGSLILLTIYIDYTYIIPILVLAICNLCLRKWYSGTSRNLKRLEGITRSPVFSHLNATLQGLTTIRANGAQHIVTTEFDHYQDYNTSAIYFFIVVNQAYSYYSEVMSLIFVMFVTFKPLIIYTGEHGGDVGLAITQSISLMGVMQWGLRQLTEVANQLTTLDRVLGYIKLMPEENDAVNKTDPPGRWPIYGRIEMKNMFLTYEVDKPPALNDITLTIRPQEKIGIVGRTGAGKSTLIAALFHLAPVKGLIKIDDIDTSTITLDTLRSQLSIIPQNPVLFSGTLRSNLDPLEEYPDYTLWRALEEVQMQATFQEGLGLDSRVMNGGNNFSVGQRQLICLARAIVRNNKILILDEATANIDPKTDTLIQSTIRRQFRNCTVLTIAHRLNTVMDSDRVLVMDAGQAVEFDHPYLLLLNREGFLYSLVQETGSAMAEQLASISKA